MANKSKICKDCEFCEKYYERTIKHTKNGNFSNKKVFYKCCIDCLFVNLTSFKICNEFKEKKLSLITRIKNILKR